MAKYRFKRSETFYIRDGWFEKAINTIHDSESKNIFSKNNASSELGIGSNMAKGLKYWLFASGLIETTNTATSLSEIGELIYQYDQYFDSVFIWFLIHYQLTTNQAECPVFYKTFNRDLKSFKKSELIEILNNSFVEEGESVNPDYLDEDTSVFLKSYIGDDTIINPEDNYICPLSTLGLMHKDGNKYIKDRPVYSSLSYLLVFYALEQLTGGESFKFEDTYTAEKSPYLIFNLDKNMYLEYLDEMRKNGLITINKTAGLNTAYFEKTLSLKDIFELEFGGKNA